MPRPTEFRKNAADCLKLAREANQIYANPPALPSPEKKRSVLQSACDELIDKGRQIAGCVRPELDESCSDLRHSLARLSPEHGEVIDLVYFHGKSVKEVAEIVGIAAATVKTRKASVLSARLLARGARHLIEAPAA
jgi:DNA-directed RNA polymerase specialized sigma24 family protein